MRAGHEDVDSSDSSAQRQGEGRGETDNSAGQTVSADALTERIAAYGHEFGDEAPTSSATRVANLRRATNVGDEALLHLADEAAAITRSQSRAITKRGRGGQLIGMPYFLRTLESLLSPERGPDPRASPQSRTGIGREVSPLGGGTDDSNSRPIVETDDVWRAALEDLRLVLTPENFEAWLAGTRVIARTDEVLRIGAPAPFHRDWLEHKLGGRVANALTRLGYGDLRVEYVVGDGVQATR